MPKIYKTKGRDRLEHFMSAHPDAHFTADEICMSLNGDLCAKSSIYRNLSLLCSEGVVRKFKSEDETSCVYQYLGEEQSCRDHFHLKCIECGTLIHLDCDMCSGLRRHIEEHHSFTVDSGRSILYGICAECASKNKKKITV